MENNRNFIATQTDNGFQVVFDNSDETPLEVTFDDINKFAVKYSESMLKGEQFEMSEKDELMLSIWEMVMIPDKTIH